jgi:hypothetical protein
MKKLITICAIVLFTAGSASADITVFDQDRPGWESAVGVYQEEFFTDATLNPGVSVVSDHPGHVDTAKGVWWDRLVCPYYGLTTTTWQFDMPVVAFGGNWNPGIPGGPGANIAVAINGSWVSVGEIPNNYTGQFWGFVSSEPFSAVRLGPGSNCYPPGGAWCETYELDNMVYSAFQVEIDIKPGSDPNAINLGSNGVIPVAILGSADFDASCVDAGSVSLGSADIAVRGKSDKALASLEDVNDDGFLDLVCHVETENLVPGDIQDGMMELTGNLLPDCDGTPIHGSDYVMIVPPEE